MSAGTIVEVSLRILRRHWTNLVVISLLLAGPGALLLAAMGMRFGEVASDSLDLGTVTLDSQVVLTAAQIEHLSGALAGYVLASVVAGVLASLAALAFSAIVVADYHSRVIEAGVALRVAMRKAPSAIGFMLVTSAIVVAIALTALALIMLSALVTGGGGATVGGSVTFIALVVLITTAVLVVLLTMRWAPAYPAMVAEDLGWQASLRRAWRLSAGNTWRVFFMVALGSLSASLMAALVSQLVAILLVDVVAGATSLDPSVAASISVAAGAVIMAPLAPVLTAVLYFDLQARQETAPAST